jgi:hypothetical protein
MAHHRRQRPALVAQQAGQCGHVQIAVEERVVHADHEPGRSRRAEQQQRMSGLLTGTRQRAQTVHLGGFHGGSGQG